jgi:hypothetical protein
VENAVVSVDVVDAIGGHDPRPSWISRPNVCTLTLIVNNVTGLKSSLNRSPDRGPAPSRARRNAGTAGCGKRSEILLPGSIVVSIPYPNRLLAQANRWPEV